MLLSQVLLAGYIVSLKYLDISIQTHENKNIKYFLHCYYINNHRSK